MQPEPMPHGQDKMTKARMFFSDFVKKKIATFMQLLLILNHYGFGHKENHVFAVLLSKMPEI